MSRFGARRFIERAVRRDVDWVLAAQVAWDRARQRPACGVGHPSGLLFLSCDRPSGHRGQHMARAYVAGLS